MVGGGLLWTGFLLAVGPKLLAPLGRRAERDGKLSLTAFAFVMIAICVSAFFMDAVGVHAISRGFVMGEVMMRCLPTQEIKRKLELLTVVLLLPIFCIYSGLDTRIDMVG